jgi:hypothetical protein
MITRIIVQGTLLVIVWMHTHWSVALAFALVFIGFEGQHAMNLDLHKRLGGVMPSKAERLWMINK